MTIENKYGIPRETIQRMVNDGVIPTAVKNKYDTYDEFKRLKNECPSCSTNEVLYRVADYTHQKFDAVKKAIYSLGKIL